MLRECLCSVALVVFVSAPGLADINQSQGFAIGMNSVVDLLGGWGTAGDSKFLTVCLDQTATQESGLSALQGNSAFGQQAQPLTSSYDLNAQGFAVDLMQHAATNSGASLIAASYESVAGGQLSLLNSLPLIMAVRPSEDR
jgi:hypothetical protein